MSTESNHLALVEGLLDLPVEQVVDCDDDQEPDHPEPDDLGAHEVQHGAGRLPGRLDLLEAAEQLVVLLLQERHLAVEVFVVCFVRQDLQLHELQASLQLKRDLEGHLTQVPGAEGVVVQLGSVLAQPDLR